MSTTLELACELINLRSVTPDDAGCQKLLVDRLARAGFTAEWLPFGEVSNVLITHGGKQPDGPSLWFLGHTDVVPSGPVGDWTSAPFEAEVRGDKLYGRGAADMKGAVAAMVTAAEAFAGARPDHAGQIGILLTSDEEGIAVDGIARVAELLSTRGDAPQYCLVGEPSSQQTLGDTVRIGRRGSIHGRLKVHGVQGHSAFPDQSDNPIHRFAPFLKALTTEQWDGGDDDFPPTQCQVTNIHAGTGAENVTPGELDVRFNLRNSPASPSAQIKARVEALLKQHGVDRYDLDWRVSGEPFCSAAGQLRVAVVNAIVRELRLEPALNTGGGTSDGRFLAPLGTEVVELGLLNSSIHQVDENTPVADLEKLSGVYGQVILQLLKG